MGYHFKFDKAKAMVTMPQLLNRYGYDLGRNNLILCPFHLDKNPSMKVYENSFYCFSCGIGGDVISFVAKLNKVNNYEALKIIDRDFNLGITDKDISYKDYMANKNHINKKDDFKKWVDDALDILCIYHRRLYFAEYGDLLFFEKLQNIGMINYFIDCLQDDPIDFYKTNREVITSISKKIT